MTIELYDLCGQHDIRFSPYCWRARLALAHKGLSFDAKPVRFTEIPQLLDGMQKTVPIVRDGETVVGDSFNIALYLEENYPDRPTLFGGECGIALARFIESWASTLHGSIAHTVIKDIHDALLPEDQTYFRQSREKAVGQSLEDHQQDREQEIEVFRDRLLPLRRMLERQPFIGGQQPLYADYIVFGSLQWPTVISRFDLLAAQDEVVRQWFDRIGALHDSMGRTAKRVCG